MGPARQVAAGSATPTLSLEAPLPVPSGGCAFRAPAPGAVGFASEVVETKKEKDFLPQCASLLPSSLSFRTEISDTRFSVWGLCESLTLPLALNR